LVRYSRDRLGRSTVRSGALSAEPNIASLVRALKRFSASWGHDLRDPLATVISGGKLVLEDELDRANQLDIVRRMVASGEGMHQLVVDLLDFTRTQLGGHMPINRREVDLGETVRTVTEEPRLIPAARSIFT